MRQDLERFESYYTFENDESLRGHRDNQGIIEFLTTERYMKQVIPPKSRILDACAGCGVYSFFLAGLGHIVTAGDYVGHNVNEIQKKQAENPVLHQIYHGSATELHRFEDASFDAVLNMGAFYHITDRQEHEKSISECLRVLKPNGLFFLAYLNKFSNIVKYHELWKDDFAAVEKILERGFADEDSLFYQSTPEEIEALMADHDLTVLHNIATDGFKGTIAGTINSMDNELFERYLNYHFKICETKSILGYSCEK
jgi:2-polyprenyl-3-methyl-5-hydroxy-6-metoxy-1,4-benzoquinol methylase